MDKKKIYALDFVIAILFVLTLFFRSAPPSPLYYTKEFRETMQSLFVLGDEDRASWLLTLSDKRFEESQSLAQKHMDSLANSQYEKGMEYLNQAEKLILSLKDKTNTTYLEDKLNASRQKSESVSALLN